MSCSNYFYGATNDKTIAMADEVSFNIIRIPIFNIFRLTLPAKISPHPDPINQQVFKLIQQSNIPLSNLVWHTSKYNNVENMEEESNTERMHINANDHYSLVSKSITSVLLVFKI